MSQELNSEDVTVRNIIVLKDLGKLYMHEIIANYAEEPI